MNEFLAAHGALIGALVVTCIVTSGTPGPNNLIVLSATLSDTRRAALKVYLGICLGFPPMVLIMSMVALHFGCLLYTSPSPRDGLLSRMPSSA